MSHPPRRRPNNKWEPRLGAEGSTVEGLDAVQRGRASSGCLDDLGGEAGAHEAVEHLGRDTLHFDVAMQMSHCASSRLILRPAGFRGPAHRTIDRATWLRGLNGATDHRARIFDRRRLDAGNFRLPWIGA